MKGSINELPLGKIPAEIKDKIDYLKTEEIYAVPMTDTIRNTNKKKETGGTFPD